MTPLTSGRAFVVFAVFALGYFLSSLVRGVTATLAPALTQEFALSSSQLGLLGGAYFLGFAMLQLPLGNWLDRVGPRRVLSFSLAAASLSCVAFAMADGFVSLLLARFICGVGVSACLIAPLTGARLWLQGSQQQSANAWMLMVGSLGLLTATLPVQWALPVYGWRSLFLVLALFFALTVLGTARQVPAIQSASAPSRGSSLFASYAPIFANRYFRRMAWVGFVNYGILVAVQTLWAGPWMTAVAGYSAAEAARGLFAMNLTMLFVFWFWGMANPRLHRAGFVAERIILRGLPFGFIALAAIAWLGPRAGWEAFAIYCAMSSVLALTHPAIGMSFAAHEAGRAISAFNLLLFAGVFTTQWCVGAALDRLQAAHWQVVDAYRAVFGLLALACGLSYLWLLQGSTENRQMAAKA
ncbi:putative sulfoacetate transporter SauU [Variovorax sp. PBS-H4]|uniref:MFS transporter n=1 Tax=Variovorax sp. PBS-H4 TaxID=434008 RepID=UPI00131623D8|nr:MFS transporter [Variovorax sp. PBS-H4]VTU32762.1 putative sulfoacetate transporter SauU [Variovorax sp. PBS-H4]